MNRSVKLVSTLLKSSNGQMTLARNHGDGSLPSLPPFGKKQIEQLKARVGSLALFGATAAVVGVYFTDWRVITDFIPFYNGKYHEGDEEE